MCSSVTMITKDNQGPVFTHKMSGLERTLNQ